MVKILSAKYRLVDLYIKGYWRLVLAVRLQG